MRKIGKYSFHTYNGKGKKHLFYSNQNMSVVIFDKNKEHDIWCNIFKVKINHGKKICDFSLDGKTSKKMR